MTNSLLVESNPKIHSSKIALVMYCKRIKAWEKQFQLEEYLMASI